MALEFDVVVVGGGHAGAQVAITLRQRGFSGSLAVVTEEADPPYERPALSKEYLSGEKTFDRILLRPPTFWAERNIELLQSRRIVELDRRSHTLVDQTGGRIGFGRLVWAAGGHARRLTCEGGDLGGVHTIRSRRDVDQLERELARAERIVIVGGGYIGLEAAAVLSKRPKSVVLLEAQERVLARVAGRALSDFYEREHRAHGVDIRVNADVRRLVGKEGRVAAVELMGGERLDADLVIVGIGLVPAVGPLLAAGARGENGVEVDEFCRTSLDGIYAAGDCAAHLNPFAAGRMIRLESVQNANDQATCVARHILGDPLTYGATPWFWSNQYDLRLQTVGLSAGHDRAVIRGSPADRSFSVVYMLDGRVIALDCVNATKDFVQGRALVNEGRVISPAVLADTSVSLKASADA